MDTFNLNSCMARRAYICWLHYAPLYAGVLLGWHN